MTSASSIKIHVPLQFWAMRKSKSKTRTFFNIKSVVRPQSHVQHITLLFPDRAKPQKARLDK
jgi:hypothetical protein